MVVVDHIRSDCAALDSRAFIQSSEDGERFLAKQSNVLPLQHNVSVYHRAPKLEGSQILNVLLMTELFPCLSSDLLLISHYCKLDEGMQCVCIDTESQSRCSRASGGVKQI